MSLGLNGLSYIFVNPFTRLLAVPLPSIDCVASMEAQDVKRTEHSFFLSPWFFCFFVFSVLTT